MSVTVDGIPKRYLFDAIDEDLAGQMVFLSGPRQVGKTTLALQLAGATSRHPAYLSWDDVRVRPRIRRGEIPAGNPGSSWTRSTSTHDGEVS